MVSAAVKSHLPGYPLTRGRGQTHANTRAKCGDNYGMNSWLMRGLARIGRTVPAYDTLRAGTVNGAAFGITLRSRKLGSATGVLRIARAIYGNLLLDGWVSGTVLAVDEL